MAKEPPYADNIPDTGELAAMLGRVAEQSQRMFKSFIAYQTAHAKKINPEDIDPQNICSAFQQMTQRMMADPARLAGAQVSLWNDYMALWQHTANKMVGQEVEPVLNPRPTTAVSSIPIGMKTPSLITSNNHT